MRDPALCPDQPRPEQLHLARVVDDAGELHDPERLAEAVHRLLAAAAAPNGIRSASITHALRRSKTPSTLAATDATARTVDTLQYRADQGPCVDLMRSTADTPTWCPDLRSDPRWPRLGGLVREHASPVRAAVSWPLRIGAHERASLNVYLDDVDVRDDRVGHFAEVVQLGLAGLREKERADQLHSALESNRRIGTALGILMSRHHCTEEQAFSLLRTVSQTANRKLREVADDVVLTGELKPVRPVS